MRAKFIGVELACFMDTGSQVITLAKPVFDAYLPVTVQPDCTYWVNLKAGNNSAIQTLGVIRVDIEGQSFRKRGYGTGGYGPTSACLTREEYVVGNLPADELGPLYWKQLTYKSSPQAMLRRVLLQSREKARAAELPGQVGKVHVPTALPLKIEADHAVVVLLPVGTHYAEGSAPSAP